MPYGKKSDQARPKRSGSGIRAWLVVSREFLRTDGLRLIRFGISGSASTAFYFAAVLLILGLTTIRADIASLLGYMAALGFSYVMQSRFTFRATKDSPRQVGAFLIVSLVGLVLSWVLMALLHLRWNVPAVWVAALICAVIPLTNYFLFKWFVFVHQSQPAESPHTEDRSNEHMSKSRTHPTQEQVGEDFDRLTEDYEAQINAAISFGGNEHRFYIDVKRNQLLQLVERAMGPAVEQHVLDLGCGIGTYHDGLKGQFKSLHGADVSEKSIEVARSAHPWVNYVHFNGETLPYPDNSFTVVFAICVMHHVPPALWPGFVGEVQRVLTPGGLGVIFEHNPYNPATQYIVQSCEIDKDAVLLRPYRLRHLFRAAGFSDIKTRTILTVPPKGPLLTKLDGWLGALPLGAQYYMTARKRRL